MCSVFYIDEGMIQKIKRLTREIDREAGNVRLGRDIHPTDEALLLRWGDHRLRLCGMKWGYPAIQGSGVLINARAESVMEKRTFADGIRYHRAVIPASHFYEWNSRKEKYTFQSKEGDVLYLAGFFDLVDNEERFIILTTEANTSMQAVHDRMPLILREDQIEDWLRDESVTEEILHQIPADLERTAKYEQMTLFPM